MYHPRIVHLCNVKEVAPSKRLNSKALIYIFYLFLRWVHNNISWISSHSPLHDVFCMSNLSTSRGNSLIYFSDSHMMVKVKWPGLCSYKNYFPCLKRKMNSLMKRLACYFHTHFVNPHNGGVVVCLLIACNHLSSSVISLNLLSIILI